MARKFFTLTFAYQDAYRGSLPSKEEELQFFLDGAGRNLEQETSGKVVDINLTPLQTKDTVDGTIVQSLICLFTVDVPDQS